MSDSTNSRTPFGMTGTANSQTPFGMTGRQLANYIPVFDTFRSGLVPAPLPVSGRHYSLQGDGQWHELESAQQTRQQVANRCHVPDQGSNNYTNYQSDSRVIFTLPNGAKDIVLGFAGWRQMPQEVAQPVVNFGAIDADVTAGGTGYAFGDVIVLPQPAFTGAAAGPTGAFAPTRLRVVGVSAGVVTGVVVDDPGIYNAVPSANPVAQASTTGVGTGATFAVHWGGGFSVHVRAGIEVNPLAPQSASGPYGVRPVRFGGSRNPATQSVGGTPSMAPQLDGKVPSGKILYSDPIQVNLPPGSTIAVRTYANGAYIGFGYWPTNVSPGDYCGFGLPAGEWSQGSASMTPQAPTASPVFGPALILGTPYRPQEAVFGLWGDSISNGVTGGTPSIDYGDSAGNIGWFQRAVGGTHPLVSFASSGNQMAYYFNASFGRSGSLDAATAAQISHACLFLGTNDTSAGLGNADIAVINAYEQHLVAELHGIRSVKKVIRPTYLPKATSAANTAVAADWARAGGSAWVGGNGLGIANYLMRSGLIPWNGTIGGVFDVAATGFTNTTPITAGAGVAFSMNASAINGNFGAVTSLCPGMVLVLEPGTANQETVTITSAPGHTYNTGVPVTLGTSFVATFAKSHAVGVAMLAFSPYRFDPTYNIGGYDVILDLGFGNETINGVAGLENPLSFGLWANPALTGDGVHPVYTSQTTGGHATIAQIVGPIIEANL